jgi:signal-transduction protein with cAMP-binding, CBS, and nucleotidyltransferase domain
MTPAEKLIELPPYSSIEDARKILQTGRINSILIPPPTNGALWRIFTSSDLSIALAQHLDNNRTKIEAFCSIATKVADPNWSLQYALDKMAEFGIQHMPVFENNQLIGLISNHDIFRHIND